MVNGGGFRWCRDNLGVINLTLLTYVRRHVIPGTQCRPDMSWSEVVYGGPYTFSLVLTVYLCFSHFNFSFYFPVDVSKAREMI